jgi:hypothetical protein
MHTSPFVNMPTAANFMSVGSNGNNTLLVTSAGSNTVYSLAQNWGLQPR